MEHWSETFDERDPMESDYEELAREEYNTMSDEGRDSSGYGAT